MRARLPFLVTLALASSIGCSAGSRAPARDPGSVDGVPLVSADGRPVALRDALAHRPTLVSFWAPWCEPCVRELPALERLSRAVAPCGGGVVGVAVGEKPHATAAFARARGLDYPQLTDEPFALADALGQRRIPATVVFDAAGRVVFTGDALDARAEAALARALGDAATRCNWP
ncbi:MAG TPA: TlpA disulfide reductase family protein [Polyangia bacterium]|jgi:thiol-disulfide isomerase/thioredoxin|nr:TlpA disulfide reductase family protein [Polyangia bacterium]